MDVDLSTVVADAAGDNPDRVEDLVAEARRLGDGVPFVLLPVRIETRFVQVEQPIANPTPLATVTARLSDAAAALQRIAGTAFATTLPGTRSQNQRFKDTVEAPLYAGVESGLQLAGSELDAVDVLLRDTLGGDAAAADAAMAAAAGVIAGLAAAGRALVALRSDFQRERLTGALAALAARAAGTLAAVEGTAVPAVRLRAALAPPSRMVRPITIGQAELAQGAATYQVLLSGIAAAGGDPAQAEQLAEAASTIPLLPAAWKRALSDAVTAAQRRAPAGRLDRLAAAVGGIRTDGADVRATTPTRSVDRLLVRFYPDDLFVDTFEEGLTENERAAGAEFWSQTASAGSSDAAARSAWRALCLGRGSQRAAWVARATEPDGWTTTPGSHAAPKLLDALTTFERRLDEVAGLAIGARFAPLVRAAEGFVDPASTKRPLPQWAIDDLRRRYAVVRAACMRIDAESRRTPALHDHTQIEARAALVRALRKLDLRLGRLRVEPPRHIAAPDAGPPQASAWTRAAGSGVLPRRFLVVAVSGGRAAHVVAGQRVPADLRLGIDPDPVDPSTERFELGPDGELVVGESIRWMVDYDEAVSKGMAVSLDITAAEAQAGFDRIYVLGLQAGRARDGAAHLEGLLDNHHYGATGLALLPVGTPTNNTEGAAAGYRTSDDVEAAFDVERGPLPFHPSDPVGANAPDGLRLARALGVRTRALAHVPGTTGRGAAETLAVNAALYPATVDAWLEEHAGQLISRDSRDRLRAFALRHVAARGLLPTFRAGAQPYGVLPAVAHTIYAADATEAVPGAGGAEAAAQQRFDRLLAETLRALAADWAQVEVPYATDPHVTDVQAHFLELLGLEPVSSSTAYRFAVNVGGRRSPTRDPRLDFSMPASTSEATPGSSVGPYAFLRRFEALLRDAYAIPPGQPLLDKDSIITNAFIPAFESISSSRAYELRVLDRVHALTGPAVGGDASYLRTLAQTGLNDLAVQTTAAEHRQPLLALLARQAILLEWRDAALRCLIADGCLTERDRIGAGASTHYVVSSYRSTLGLTRWSYLLARLGDVDGLQGPAFNYANLEGPEAVLAELLPRYVRSHPNGPHVARVQAAERHASTVASLADIPAARLEPLLYEHLDLAGHRLDAWITGLAQRRLTAMRESEPYGAHVGAYGWLDDLRPAPAHPLAGNVPAALAGDPSRPIYKDLASQGFIQAPSPDHAVTAAILRSGFLSQRGAQQDIANRMAVNLSSRRTRLALGLIEGVRAGNRLGALLGYRLERFLHEAYTTGPTLDAVIGPLRRAYPSAAGYDVALATEAAERQVCDGLAIVDAVRGWLATPAGVAAQEARGASSTLYEVLSGSPSSRPWGLDGGALPAAGDARLDGVLRAIDHIADALDAVGDLVIAEAVHQIAVGNHQRSAAALAALSEGKAPPRPEVVDTPRSGTPVTHRVLLQLPDALLPAAWAAIPPTPRAQAEPVLNAWAAELLGDPAKLRVRLRRVQDGAEAGDISAVDLGLQALDLVAILGPGVEAGIGEYAARAIDAARPESLDDAAPPAALQIDLGRAPGWAADVRGVGDTLPLLEAIGALLGRGRAATARDYAPAEEAGPDGVDGAELLARVQAARTALEAAGVGLARALAGDETLGAEALAQPRRLIDAHADDVAPLWAEREDWRARLLAVAAFGIPAALPPSLFTSQNQVLRALREAAEAGLLAVADRLREADAAAAPEEAARKLFGEGFMLLARATVPDLGHALAAELASPSELHGWLHGAGAVRDGAGGLAELLVLADAHGAAPPAGAAAVQLPHVDGEAWLGGELAAPGPGRLVLALFGPEALPAAGATGAALVIDEWNERIPAAQETTGVAVHYDQPDATAPQCVLIAVPPVKRGRWRLGDLLQTLHDTLEVARSRTVELEHLQATLYGQLLPLISGEVVPDAAGGLPPAGTRVMMDFGANN